LHLHPMISFYFVSVLCLTTFFIYLNAIMFLLLHFSLLSVFNLNDSLILISVIVLFYLTNKSSRFSVKDFLIPPNIKPFLFQIPIISFVLPRDIYLFTTRSAFYEKHWFHLKNASKFCCFPLVYLSKAMVSYLFFN